MQIERIEIIQLAVHARGESNYSSQLLPYFVDTYSAYRIVKLK